jgi:hypothetical protein
MSLLAQAEQFFAALDGHDLDEVVAAIAPSANIRTPIGSFTGGEALPRVDVNDFSGDSGLHPRNSWHRSRIRPGACLRAPCDWNYDWAAGYAQWRFASYGQEHRHFGI